MKGLDSSGEIKAIQRQERVVDSLRDQLRDAEDGESLRSAGDIRRELDLEEAKLKRLRTGAK